MMKKIAPILPLIVILGIPQLSLPTQGRQAPLHLLPTQTGPETKARQTLYERFKANYQTNHQTAYEAAREYLQKYPNDDTEETGFMKRWVAAYEKVAGASPQPAAAPDRPTNITPTPVTPPAASEAGAASGPSLADTVLWLKNQSDSFGTSTYYWLFKTSFFGKIQLNKPAEPKATLTEKISDFDGCTLTISSVTEKPESSSYYASRYSARIRIPLASIDADKITVKQIDTPGDPIGWYVVLPVKNDAQSITRSYELVWGKHMDKNETGTKTESSFLLLLNNEDIARRAAKAFTHAVSLCKGQQKKEPF